MSLAELFSRKYLLSLAILLGLCKLGSLALYYVLPKNGVEFNSVSSRTVPYHAHKYSAIMDVALKSSEKPIARPEPKPKPEPVSIYQITNLILKGVYAEEGKGFIFVAEKSKPDANTLLTTGESIKGYKLIQVLPKEALFESGGKRYSLSMDEKSGPKNPQQVKTATKPNIPISDDVIRALPRKEIDYYTSDLTRIWSNIKIKEVVDGNQIDGFKILGIKRNSIFYQLGLQPNDVIIKVNNKPLKNYADALNAYRSVKKNTALKLTVLRDGMEKELEYEIF